MTPETQIERLAEIMSSMNREYVPVNDFAESLKMLLSVIRDNALISEQNKAELVSNINELTDRVILESDNLDSKITATDTALKQAIRDLQTAFNDIELLRGEQGPQGEIGPQGPQGIQGKDGSPDSAEDIRNKLELLTGDERLDRASIRGLDGLPTLQDFADVKRMAQANSLPATTSFINGKRAKNINFSGATVSHKDDTATVVITGGGGGAVDSVNGQTGVVVLDADDIDDTSTTQKFVTAGDLTKLSNLSGTNTGDVTVSDTAEIDFTLTGQQISASIVAGSIDETKLDASTNASLDLADTSLKPNDLITELNATAHRVFYSNGSGDVTELALGADGTFLKSNGASSAPSFAVPAGSGDVSKVGTPVNNQVGVWTGDGTLEGDADLTFDTTTNTLATGVLQSSTLTASEIVITDASKNLVSAAVATYPSLTELTYVKGVTSAIQTQLGNKQPLDTQLTDLAGLSYSSNALKYIRVNAGENGWELATVSGGSGISRSVSSISSNTTAGATAQTDYVYFVTGTTTLTLPTAVGNQNLYVVKCISGTTTIDTTSAQTIDGSSSINLSVANTSISVVSDGSNWLIV